MKFKFLMRTIAEDGGEYDDEILRETDDYRTARALVSLTQSANFLPTTTLVTPATPIKTRAHPGPVGRAVQITNVAPDSAYATSIKVGTVFKTALSLSQALGYNHNAASIDLMKSRRRYPHQRGIGQLRGVYFKYVA